jgi:hypothetical protein
MTETDISKVLIEGEYATIMGVKYKRVGEPKPQTLYNRLYDELGYGFEDIENVVDLVEDWLPKEHDTNSDGWNKCVRMLRENLR